MKKRHEAFEYYSKILEPDYRCLIYDTGYSGSVSCAISNIINKPVDKFYIHESELNKKRDFLYKTKTFIIDESGIKNFDLIFEEVFSSLEGSCIGFREAKPVFDLISCTPNMEAAHTLIEKNSIAFANYMHFLFGKYLKFVNVTDFSVWMHFVLKEFQHNQNLKLLFKDFFFDDKAARKITVSLDKKINV